MWTSVFHQNSTCGTSFWWPRAKSITQVFQMLTSIQLVNHYQNLKGQTWKPKLKKKATFALRCISLIAFDVILSSIIRHEMKTTVAVLSLLSLTHEWITKRPFVFSLKANPDDILKLLFSIWIKKLEIISVHKQFAGAISTLKSPFLVLSMNCNSSFLLKS